MIPMWMFGMAISTGNACILKPSEKDPSVPMRLTELFVEAGGPVGLLQCINGDKEIVDAICDHPTIKAMEQAAKDILGAAYGSAGERCMALPVVVPVGEGTAEKFLKAFMPKLEAMTVGTSTDADADYGPVVTRRNAFKGRTRL